MRAERKHPYLSRDVTVVLSSAPNDRRSACHVRMASPEDGIHPPILVVSLPLPIAISSASAGPTLDSLETLSNVKSLQKGRALIAQVRSSLPPDLRDLASAGQWGYRGSRHWRCATGMQRCSQGQKDAGLRALEQPLRHSRRWSHEATWKTSNSFGSNKPKLSCNSAHGLPELPHA
jgi:hypothetical protein